MKKIVLSIAVLFTAIVSNAQFTSAKLTAAGLTCAMCTKAIYNALEKIPSVSSVNTDIKNSSFLLSFQSGSPVDPDVLRAAVEEAGFSVSRLSLTGQFDNVAISGNAHVNIGGRTYHFLQAGNSTSLNGEKTLTLVDKKFLSTKEFKKYLGSGGHLCLETGKAEACCPGNVARNSRIYHVTM